MKLYSNIAAPRRYLPAALALLSLQSLSAPADKPDRQDSLQPPENWYQVEVVLFTQQGNSGAEAAPQNYQLQFPENWLELSDPTETAAVIRLPIVLNSSISNYSPIDNTPVPEASIPYKYQNHPEVTSAEVADTAIDSIEEGSVEEGSIEESSADIFVPEYEQPFQQLEPELRDLNHSALALDRRHYNVLFHQAWRFQIDHSEQSPWVIVKAGSTETGRYQIEGTIRFYKSRFLHFESNLWRLKFADNETNVLELPEIPEKPISPFKELMLRALSFSAGLARMNPEQTTATKDADLFDVTAFYNLGSLLADAQDRQTADQLTDIAYPIDEVWPFDRSQRLQEGEIYYIDHPEMGALVTVKSYTPEPLNRPMQPEVAADFIEDPVKTKQL